MMYYHLTLLMIKHHSISFKDTLIYPFMYLLTFFIVFTGYIGFGNTPFLDAIPKGTSGAFSIIRLSFDSTLSGMLKEGGVAGTLLLGNYYLVYCLSMITLICLSVLLLITALSNYTRLLIRGFKKDLLIIFGFNNDTKAFIKNLKKERNKTIIVLDSSKVTRYPEEKFFASREKVAYTTKPYSKKSEIVKSLKRIIKNRFTHVDVVTFFEDDNINFAFSAAAQDFLSETNANVTFIINTHKPQQSYLDNFISNYQGDITKRNGSIRTFNKYDLIAYDFICRNNFAKYIDKSLINDDCTIKDCDINLFVFGFGKVNQALVRDILINTQFVTKEEVEDGYLLKPKRMNVKIYDRKLKNDDIDISLGFMKYNKANFNQEDYLELIDNYLESTNFKFDTSIDQFNVIDEIYDELKVRKERRQVNFFLISLDSGFVNWNVAYNLKKHLSCLSNSSNMFFFRSKEDIAFEKSDDMICFGTEVSKDKNVVLSYENVVKDKVYAQAKKCHYAYLHSDAKVDGVSEKELNDSFKWLNKFKRLSNLYAIANVFFKLSLMKLDDVKKEFREAYSKNNSEYSYDLFVKPKKVYSKREVLRFLEHERWNAFEIGNGVLPLKIKKCKELTAKYDKFTNQIDDIYHLCITTAKGLVAYHDLAISLKYDEAADVVKYDDDLMDSLYDNLDLIDYYTDLLK